MSRKKGDSLYTTNRKWAGKVTPQVLWVRTRFRVPISLDTSYGRAYSLSVREIAFLPPDLYLPL